MRRGSRPEDSTRSRSAPSSSIDASASAASTCEEVHVVGSPWRNRIPTTSCAARHGTDRVASASATEVVVAPERTMSSRSEEHTSELQSRGHLVCRLLLEKKKE